MQATFRVPPEIRCPFTGPYHRTDRVCHPHRRRWRPGRSRSRASGHNRRPLSRNRCRVASTRAACSPRIGLELPLRRTFAPPDTSHSRSRCRTRRLRDRNRRSAPRMSSACTLSRSTCLAFRSHRTFAAVYRFRNPVGRRIRRRRDRKRSPAPRTFAAGMRPRHRAQRRGHTGHIPRWRRTESPWGIGRNRWILRSRRPRGRNRCSAQHSQSACKWAGPVGRRKRQGPRS